MCQKAPLTLLGPYHMKQEASFLDLGHFSLTSLSVCFQMPQIEILDLLTLAPSAPFVLGSFLELLCLPLRGAAVQLLCTFLGHQNPCSIRIPIYNCFLASSASKLPALSLPTLPWDYMLQPSPLGADVFSAPQNKFLRQCSNQIKPN